MYSYGTVTTKYGSTNQYTVDVDSGRWGYEIFSNITKDYRFNYGLDNFDVCVN